MLKTRLTDFVSLVFDRLIKKADLS